ncbi:hypothetical protein ACFFLS_05885 [Flavobacterium procerum]|uniref:DoxX family protein n=1 Tax=Flavobacterium procerum TaxID=1455569 RepID=A0ABV6BR92_9FLAO
MEEEKKEMNIIVMFYLVVLIGINLFTALSSLELWKHVIKYENASPVCVYGLLLTKILSCVFIALFFKWSMWGFYGLLAMALIQFVLLLILKASMVTACLPFVYLGITYLVLHISENGETAWDNLE